MDRVTIVFALIVLLFIVDTICDIIKKRKRKDEMVSPPRNYFSWRCSISSKKALNDTVSKESLRK